MSIFGMHLDRSTTLANVHGVMAEQEGVVEGLTEVMRTMGKKALEILASIGAGLVVAPLAAFLAFIGCIVIVGGVIIPVARLLGVGDSVIDHLPGPVFQTLYIAIIVVTLGTGLAAAIYSALKSD
jgi:hypothetical protein